MKKTMKISSATSLMLVFGGVAQASEPYVGLGFGAFNLGSGVTKKATSGAYLQLGDDFSENFGGEFVLVRQVKRVKNLPFSHAWGLITLQRLI